MWKDILLMTLAGIVGVYSQATDTITISQGQLRGVRNSGAEEFLGIPYGDCPARFSPVKNPSPWTGVFDATTFAPGCYQNCTSFPSACPASVSECCFTLNLYRPLQTTATSNLPVMVHFHGGSYSSGSASAQLLNASRLVGLSGGVLVVNCNYRLYAFGFWFNVDEANPTAPGNVALLDQEKCLQWIQSNVAAFGGDPSNVTIWGQSAGASSLGFHLQRRILNNNQPVLFHRLLFQSWPAGIQPRKLDQSKLYNTHFAQLANCPDPLTVTQCLRSKTAAEILQASMKVRFDVTSYPDSLITIGLPWQATLELDSFYLKYNNIDFVNRYASQIGLPIVWGVDKDEGTLFIYEAVPYYVPMLLPLAKSIVSALWHVENLLSISNLYNISALNVNTTDYHDTVAQILGDYAFTCPLRNMSRALSNAGNTRVYAYRFDYILKANGILYASSSWAPECYKHVCHKSEMPFVFNPWGVPTIQLTEPEENFAQTMGCYWTNFGKTANPNSPRSVAPAWNAFTTSVNHNLYLKLAAITDWSSNDRDLFCDFWDHLGYVF